MTTVKELKEIIKDLPDDMLVLYDGGCHMYDTTYWSLGKAEKEPDGGRYFQSEWLDEPNEIDVLLVE